MNKLLITCLFLLGFISNSLAQIDANKGDYILLTNPNETLGHYIFKKTNKVCYNYNLKTKIIENEYIQNKKLIKETFKIADKINFKETKGVDESLIELNNEYIIIEYRKNNIVNRLCIPENSDIPEHKQVLELKGYLYKLW